MAEYRNEELIYFFTEYQFILAKSFVLLGQTFKNSVYKVKPGTLFIKSRKFYLVSTRL